MKKGKLRKRNNKKRLLIRIKKAVKMGVKRGPVVTRKKVREDAVCLEGVNIRGAVDMLGAEDT